MNDFLNRIKQPFRDNDYRHTYADEFLNSFIATQIKILRQQRQWTQGKLADQAGMKQTRISVLEDVNYSSWSISTLRRLAKAFDLRLRVSFEEFNTIIMDFEALSRKSLERHPFTEDMLFKEAAEIPSDVKPLSAFQALLAPERQLSHETIPYSPFEYSPSQPAERGTLRWLEDPLFGDVLLQSGHSVWMMSKTPRRTSWIWRPVGADNVKLYRDMLDYPLSKIEEWYAKAWI